jgi:branched-subunit amino acid ABC-type transport system permease component
MELAVQTLTNVLIFSAMYILAALGFAFLFNMLRILNFAHGAIYMVGGYIGYLFIVGMGLNQWLALLLATLIIAAFGVFLEKFCFRPFVGDFNRTIMICIAIAVILQTAVNLMVGTKMMAIPAFVEGVFRAGSFSVSYERIITFAIGAALLGAVTWFVNRTKWGQQMQAIAQDREGASLQGINIHRTSALAFALGCGLAAIAGCLLGAYLRLSPFMGDLMLIRVLIIVMLAGIGSIGGILITGLILGSLNAVLPVLLSGATSDAIIIAMVVVLILVRPQGFFGIEATTSESQRSDFVSSKTVTVQRKWVKPAAYTGLVVIFALLPLLLISPYMLHILILTFIFTIAAVSLRTIVISGQFPLAHAAFMGIGAYLAGMAAKWLGWSPWLTIPVSALVTMGIGMLIGYPFARLRALYYAMGSLFFGIGVIYIIYAGGVWTGGYSGLTGIAPLFPTATSRVPYYYLFLGLALVSLIALYRFEISRIGTNLKAIAQSYLVASSVGINEGWYRVLAVGVGCFFAGLAGAGYAHYNMALSPSSFNFLATLWLVMYVLIGGIGNFAGPIIGTFILVLIPEFARDLKIFSPFISAGILLIVVYLMPQGLVALPQLIRSRLLERRKGEKAAHAS